MTDLSNFKESSKAMLEKKGNLLSTKRTASIDGTKPVKHLVSPVKDGSKKYKKASELC